MNEYLEWILQNYREAGILIDTNVLLLIIVGIYDRERVGRTRRTVHYVKEDFDLAIAFAHQFKWIITHQSILTETSNLAGQSSGREPIRVRLSLASQISRYVERPIDSIRLAEEPGFPNLGLTDSAIALIASDGIPVLTDDLALYHYLIQHKLPAINFTHLRAGNLFS